MQIHTLPDIVAADGAAHAFSATMQLAKWVQVDVISSTSGIRVGDLATITPTRGAPVATAAGQFFPQNSTDITDNYDLSKIGYIGTTGDRISVMYGT